MKTTASLGYELIGSDYVRPPDNTIMVEVSCGWFVHSHHEMAKRHPANDNVTKPESLETIEVPWHAKARKALTEFETLLYGTDGLPEDAPRQHDDKRRIRTKPKCNLAPSKSRWRDITILRKPDDNLFLSMARHAVGFHHRTTKALASILAARFDDAIPVGLRDNAAETQRNRARIERYSAEFAESDNPEHTLWPRESRNASPSRKKDSRLLNAFMEYFELNKSFEPLQSNFLQADNDNFGDPDWEEGDIKEPQRDAEAELENRPTVGELQKCYDGPSVQFETRRVNISDIRLSEDGYLCNPFPGTYRDLIVPVSGDVDCIGLRKDELLAIGDSARKALPKRGIRRTQKRLNDYVDIIERPGVIRISDVAKSRKWSIYRVGDLRFAPFRTKHHYCGQLTHYRVNDRWFRVKEDEYGTPYGPASKGSDERNWKALNPRSSYAGVLPYTVDSADQLQFGYAFGKTSGQAIDNVPFDDVVERGQTLATLNDRISPQARRVANMVVST
jgi:hypothetical protein